MIQLFNVTKIFKSKSKEDCTALNNISFTLGDNGFVFVIGKSGSGKTTLLSLIGGLDKFNSGEIIVNGVKLSKLKGTNFDYYRNDTIGFIFQDFQLFDELTVEENIKLALDFKNDKDKSKIKETLKAVELENYESRYPRELSGGEKQRVAIARVLVKNPSIILADEPTGNLDSETTESVLKILKNISKDHLVIIVSHNIYDAHKYADYILELKEGNLSGTYKRNDNVVPSIELDDGILRLPLHKEILESEKEDIIKNHKYNIKDIIQDDRDFSPISLENTAKVEEKAINKTHISFFNAFKRGIKFLSKALTPMLVFSFITASLFSIINSSYAIKNINEEDVCNYDLNQFKNDYYYFADEGELVKTKPKFYDKDPIIFDKLKDANYEGEIFKSYRSNFTNRNRHAFFVDQSPGSLLITNEKFIENRFGNLEYVVKADKEEPYGVYCFDFLIDFMNAMNPSMKRDYNSYLGFKFKNGKILYLNGVIKTDYKIKYEKYLDVIFDYKNYLSDMTPMLKRIDKKLYNDYVLDINYYFMNIFSFNNNFIEDYVANPFNLITSKYCSLISEENNETYNDLISFNQTMSFNALSSAIYKKLTGRYIDVDSGSYEKIDPIKVKIVVKNDDVSDYNQKVYEFIFDHVCSSDVCFNVLKDDSLKFFKENLFNLNGFVLDSTADIKSLHDKGCFDDNYYLQNNIIVSTEVSKRLSTVFDKVFSIVILGLLICTIISSSFYGIYVVKNNMRNVGICKSLGARTFDILIILALNLFIAILFTIGFYCGLASLFMFIIESILHRALEKSSTYFFPAKYKLLFNSPIVYSINIALIVIISIASFITLFIKINSLKPIELIKSKK